MDGAGKFVRRDPVAGLIITIINILGGLGIGMADGMAAADAEEIRGLDRRRPPRRPDYQALLISVASGILVTKQRGRHQLSREIVGQFLLSGRALRLAAGVTVLVGFLPGLPILPFALMATVFYFLGKAADAEKAAAAPEGSATPSSARLRRPLVDRGGRAGREGDGFLPEALAEMLRVDRIAVEVGYRLIPLACGTSGTSQLVEHIGMLRKQFALSFGMVIPSIRMKDNLMLEPNGYRVLLAGQEIARGSLYPDHWLAMGPGLGKDGLPGVRTTDPTFGLPAVWVPSSAKADAEALGCTVVDPESVLVTHLTELLREHAHEILSRDDVQKLVDRTKESNPAVVQDFVPDILPLGTVQAVLANLLRERIPIRNLVLILETLADHGRKQKDPEQLAEIVAAEVVAHARRTLRGLAAGRSMR
jgi:flagellar biosynthesis protein FlhA